MLVSLSHHPSLSAFRLPNHNLPTAGEWKKKWWAKEWNRRKSWNWSESKFFVRTPLFFSHAASVKQRKKETHSGKEIGRMFYNEMWVNDEWIRKIEKPVNLISSNKIILSLRWFLVSKPSMKIMNILHASMACVRSFDLCSTFRHMFMHPIL